MKQQGLLYFTDTHLTLFALVLFAAVFISMLLWINRPGSKSHYKGMADLPLKSQNSNEQELK